MDRQQLERSVRKIIRRRNETRSLEKHPILSRISLIPVLEILAGIVAPKPLFPSFAKLPIELQMKIWSYTLGLDIDQPRAQHTRLYKHTEHAPLEPCNPHWTRCVSTPVAMRVCSLSRQVAWEAYLRLPMQSRTIVPEILAWTWRLDGVCWASYETTHTPEMIGGERVYWARSFVREDQQPDERNFLISSSRFSQAKHSDDSGCTVL